MKTVSFFLTLIAIIISDILTFKDFDKLFSWITILTSIYLICSSLILRQYLNKSKLENILFLSVLIGLLLASYIIYSGITYSLIISLAMIVNTFVVALKCFSSYLYYSIFILFTSLLLSFFIVPEYKATGMFIVLTCCSSLQLIFSLLIIKRKLYAKK